MNAGFQLYPTGPGLLCAAAAVAAGAPLFSDGLRALRLRRGFTTLRSRELAESPTGFVHVHGRVALESPLFAPLSGRRCAGFRLEVRAAASPMRGFVDERRRFSLTDGEHLAQVIEQRARWELAVTGERDVPSGDPLSDHLTALIQRVPEMAWARGAGATLHLVERALLAGAECHVIGLARHGRALEPEIEIEWARTGTDDEPWIASPGTSRESAREPDLWIGHGDHLDFLLVTDQPPDLRRLPLPRWRELGTVVGPALSLAGLSYLASALDTLRAAGSP